MDTNQKFWIYVWTLLAATVLIITGAIYNYNLKVVPLYNQVQVECIKQGGTWGAMTGSSEQQACDMRK